MATKERLYNIENECPNYHAQLEQARDILHLNYGDRSSSKITSRGRHQWVLRWLLKKLQSADDVGAISRSTPETWSLIEDLVNVLPWSIVTQNLRSFCLLSSVERALSEAFGRHDNAQGERRVSTSGYDTHSEETSSSVTVNGSSLTTESPRKRKVVDSENLPPNKRRALPAQDVPSRSTTRSKANLFLRLSSMLRFISSETGDRMDDSATAAIQISKIKLQASPEQAAKILAGAIDGLVTLHPESSLSISLELMQQISSHTFEPFLQIWRQRKLATKKGTDCSHNTFTSTCLAPCSRYLHLSREWARKPHLNLARHYDPTEIIQILEHLIARHLVMPCRQDFFTTDSKKSFVGLYDHLKVLSSSNALNSKSSEEESRILQVIPIFLQIGLRCSNLTSPQKKLQEIPWIDHMFGAIAKFLGFDLDLDSPSEPRSSCYEALNKAMRQLIAANFQIKGETLRRLSTGFARSLASTGDILFWNFHAGIIALNPTIYLPNSEARIPRELGQPMKTVLTQIRSSGWSVSGLQKGSSAAKRYAVPYDIVKYDVLAPLIQAFAVTRETPQLLEIWFSELRDPVVGNAILQRDNLESRDKHRSHIWEDFDISKRIASCLEASLSPPEYLELLKDYIVEVTQNSCPAQGESELRLCSALRIITTLLLGIREFDSTTLEMSPIEEIITECMKILEHYDPASYTSRGLAWRLLSAATRIWVCSTNDLGAAFPDGLSKLPLVLHERLYSISTTSILWGMVQEATEALSCYGSILQEANKRHFIMPWESPPGQLFDMMRNILSSKDADVDDWARYTFSSVIVHCPVLLMPAASETDENSRVVTLKLQTDIVRLILDEARNKITVWREEDQTGGIPGTRALHDCWQSLLEQILQLETLAPQTDHSARLAKQSLVIKNLIEMESSSQSSGTQAKDDYLFFRRTYEKVSCVFFKNHDAEPIVKSTLNGLDRFWQNLNKDQVYTAVTSLLHVLSDLEFSKKIDTQELVSLLSRHLDAQKGPESFSAKQWEQEHAVIETLIQIMRKQHLSHSQTILDPSKCAETASSSKSASLRILNCILNEAQGPDAIGKKDFYDEFCGRIEKENPNVPASYPIVIECLAGALEHGRNDTTEKKDRLQRAVGPYLQENEFRLYLEVHLLRKGTKVAVQNTEAASHVTQILAKETAPLAFRVLDYETLQMMNGSFPDKILRHALEKCCKSPGSRGCWRLFTMLYWHTTKMSSTSGGHIHSFENSSGIFMTLCNFLSQTEDIELFEMISQTLIRIVRHEKFQPTQLAFETLLTALQSLASPSAPSLPKTGVRRIFSSICTLTRILLIRASLRKRLRGRMHLLMPLMRSLLSCFFTQAEISSLAFRNRINSPPWLGANNSCANADRSLTATLSTISKPISEPHPTKDKPLTAKQATRYAQLLTTLVNPSTSSVSIHKQAGTAPLTDTVRAARTTAAHHVSPIIAELCTCLMKGGTYCAPGVREALMPGIWATLEVMASVNVGVAGANGHRGNGRGLGVIEVLGASFGDEKGGDAEDAEGMRSLLKGLVGEWRRVGGGG